MKRPETQAGRGIPMLAEIAESGTISGWLPQTDVNVFQTHIASMDSGLLKRFGAFSAIPLPASSPWFDAQKTVCKDCGRIHRRLYDRTTHGARDLSCGDTRVYIEFEVRRIRCPCTGKVRREHLDFLADNPLYTKRFAWQIGCRASSIKDVAKEFNLHWGAVKELDKQYMRAQLERIGQPGPKAIGIDEISVRRPHEYRIVVSDLIRGWPIWFGGKDRSEASMKEFYDWLGPKKTKGIRLALMNMGKPFRSATNDRAPQAAILFDKLHVMRHLNDALDKVRKSQYARLSGKARRYIKGNKYVSEPPGEPDR